MEYVVFDLETTGLSAERDGIVEIGAMLVRGEEIVEAPLFYSLVNPERSIPWHASRVHGIRDGDVRGAPTLERVLPGFLDAVGGRPVVAHNASFDCGFMRVASRRYGLQWAPRTEICTVQLSRRAFPQERSHKLDLLAARLNLQFEDGGRHRSLGDVRVTAHAFVMLRRMLAATARG